MSIDPFMNRLNEAIADMRRREFETSNQWTLGRFIDALEAVENQSGTVRFDFPNAVPTTFDSWRGIYAELALGWRVSEWPDPGVTVDLLLSRAKAADGATFEGYKGGDFLMSRDTPLWVDNYSEYHRVAVTGLMDQGHEVVILTAYQPD